MNPSRLQAASDRRAATARSDLAEPLARLVDDAGVTHRELAAASGLARSYIARVLAGEDTGPAIRDRWAAPMLELLLAGVHPRFARFTEVAVRRPSRGWIDALLHEPRERLAIASELQSELRRLEQLVRWQAAKADSLPSWEGWDQLGDEPQVSRLLVVRRTRATRAVATEYARQLRVAYPAHPDDALAALTGTAPWPGPALLWVSVGSHGARFVPGR